MFVFGDSFLVGYPPVVGQSPFLFRSGWFFCRFLECFLIGFLNKCVGGYPPFQFVLTMILLGFYKTKLRQTR